jgi:hypothetical protein
MRAGKKAGHLAFQMADLKAESSETTMVASWVAPKAANSVASWVAWLAAEKAERKVCWKAGHLVSTLAVQRAVWSVLMMAGARACS